MNFCALSPCLIATKTKPHLLQKVGMEQIGEEELVVLDEEQLEQKLVHQR
jgi:hypothetical protein